MQGLLQAPGRVGIVRVVSKKQVEAGSTAGRATFAATSGREGL